MLARRADVHHGVGWVVGGWLVGLGQRAATPLAPAAPGATRPVIAVLAIVVRLGVIGRAAGRVGVRLGGPPPGPAALAIFGGGTVTLRRILGAGRIAVTAGP